MAKVDLKLSFECPACKQIDGDVSFGKAININTELQYIGSGDSLPYVDSVTVTCSGCKMETEIDY